MNRKLRSRAPRRAHPRRVGSSYLLSGLVRCRTCNRALSGQDAKSGKFSYYVCQSVMKRGSGACDALRLNARRFEELVVGKIRENVLTESNIRELVRMVDEEMDGVAKEQRQRLETIESEMVEVRRRLDRLYNLVEITDLAVDDFKPRIREHRERQEKLEASAVEALGEAGGPGRCGDNHCLRSRPECVPERERVDGAQGLHRELREGDRGHARQRRGALHHPHFSIDTKSSGTRGRWIWMRWQTAVHEDSDGADSSTG